MTQRPWRLALSVQASLVQASWTGVRLMLGYRALALGADPFFLGLLASSFALPALLTALPAGRLTDRVGGSVVAITGMLIAAAGTAGGFAFPGLWTLLAAAVCIGFGQILIMVGQQTFVAHVSAQQGSDAAFGTLTAAASIGQLVGPPTVTTLASLAIFGGQTSPNTTVGLIACVAFILLATPAYFVIRPTDRALKAARPANNDSSRTGGASAQDARDVALADRQRRRPRHRRPDVRLRARLGDRTGHQRDRRRPTAGVAGRRLGDQPVRAEPPGRSLRQKDADHRLDRAAAAALIALPFVGVWGAIAVMIGLGLGLGIPQPLTMAWVTSLTPPASHGATLGMRLTSNRLAQITLPLAVGAAAAPLGVLGIFWANAAILLGAIGIMARSNTGNTN